MPAIKTKSREWEHADFLRATDGQKTLGDFLVPNAFLNFLTFMFH
jgi:hypothetical protein